MKELSREELEKSNGKDGQPALVSANGKVYDVTESRMWKNGTHVRSHEAGNDLSLELQAAPHGPEVLERYKQIATLMNPKPDSKDDFPEPPALFRLILSQHPHPVSVHFPIALLVIASFLTVLSLFIDLPGIKDAVVYNLIFGTLAAPAAIKFGFISWYYNYGGIWTSIYIRKTILSVILLCLTITALTLYFGFMTTGQQDTFYWLYTGLVILLAPVVMSLGFLGGKITFPS